VAVYLLLYRLDNCWLVTLVVAALILACQKDSRVYLVLLIRIVIVSSFLRVAASNWLQTTVSAVCNRLRFLEGDSTDISGASALKAIPIANGLVHALEILLLTHLSTRREGWLGWVYKLLSDILLSWRRGEVIPIDWLPSKLNAREACSTSSMVVGIWDTWLTELIRSNSGDLGLGQVLPASNRCVLCFIRILLGLRNIPLVILAYIWFIFEAEIRSSIDVVPVVADEDWVPVHHLLEIFLGEELSLMSVDVHTNFANLTPVFVLEPSWVVGAIHLILHLILRSILRLELMLRSLAWIHKLLLRRLLRSEFRLGKPGLTLSKFSSILFVVHLRYRLLEVLV